MALRLVAYRRADRFTSTGGVAGPTHRPALLIPAGVGVEAVIVHPALNLDAGHVRVALVSVLTGADWLVVDHPAESVLATSAGVLAELVDAGVGLAALVV